MNEEMASTSKNLDQDTEQMRSEGKGRRFGIGKMAVCVRVRVFECVRRALMAPWHGKYERCQAGACFPPCSVN